MSRTLPQHNPASVGDPDPDALTMMRDRGGEWAAYQNYALDSAACGHMAFLNVGEGRTYKVAPQTYPGNIATAWAYKLVGYVVLETGRIDCPQCGCHRGSTCDVSHDPASCSCDQCRAAEAAAALSLIDRDKVKGGEEEDEPS